MSKTCPWPEIPKGGRWAIDLMEELLEQTDQGTDELSARARELREEATRSDVDGYRDAALAMADRYDAAAVVRLSGT